MIVFSDSCRGRDAERCYHAFDEKPGAAMTIEHLSVVINRSTRYTRSVLLDYPEVFRVGDSAALRKDDQVQLRK